MARAIWSGAISFGLVTIPVKLMTAIRDHRIRLHMLSEDGSCRLRRKLFCPETGEEFDFRAASRGYEIAPDQYVLIQENELKSLKVESGHQIDILSFASLDEIDPIYFDRSYYLVPDELGVKSYHLFLEALSKQKRVGIGKFVMRNREYLAALRPLDKVIGLATMRYADELVQPERELDLPADVELDQSEIRMAERLIEALSTEFDATRYHDDYNQRLEELIRKKAEGEEVVTHEPAEERRGQVINLMDALKQSLEKVEGRKRQPSKSKTRGKRKSA